MKKTAFISVDSHSIPKEEFSVDRNVWPDVTYMNVIQFLVYQQSAFSKDEVKNLKSLEKIVKDDVIFKCNIEKATYFHKQVVMPEIVCKNFSREAVLASRTGNPLPTSSSVRWNMYL